MNSGKKFDICLMNPPYGSTGGDTLHLRFVDKCLEIANKQVVVMPFTFVTKLNNKSSNKYKEKFDPYLSSIEEIDSKLFTDTAMPNVGIYELDSNKSDNIKINYLKGDSIEVQSLLDLKEFSKYEEKFIKYLLNQNSQIIVGDCGRLNSWKSQVKDLSGEKYKNKLLSIINYACKKLKPYYDENIFTFGLLVNRSNGAMNGTYLTPKNGQIFSSYDEFIDHFYKNPVAIGYNCLLFKSFNGAENCKLALQHPLLRFCLYKSQKDQNITQKLYKYIPAINWEDDRVKTDEGLLEVCGCPKNKCKEYAEYCKKMINKVDNGEKV